jgi:hypothetical protein
MSDIAKDTLGGFVGDRWGKKPAKLFRISTPSAPNRKEMYGTFVEGSEAVKKVNPYQH